MPNNYEMVKGVDWREVFPWIILTRAFSVAVSIPVLFLASVGVGLTISGWGIVDNLLIPEKPAVALVGATSEEMESATNQGDAFTEHAGLEDAADDPLENREQVAEKGVAVQPTDHVMPAMGPLVEEPSKSVFERLMVGEGLSLIGELHDILFDGNRELDTRTGYAICIADFTWLLIVWGFFQLNVL